MIQQSLVLRDFNVFAVQERHLPELVPNSALVRILATAICGSDIHGYAGVTGRRFPDQVMGHETCGIVEEVADPENSALLGKRVVINPVLSCQVCELCRSDREHVCKVRKVMGVTSGVDGAFAQYVVVPYRNLAEVKAHLTPELSTAVEPLAVGYHAVIRASLKLYDRVLIIGGGPIGQAVAFGCAREGFSNFIFSESAPAKREFLKKFAFQTVTPSELEAFYETHPRPTVVFDAVGNSRSFADAVKYADATARIVLVGMDTPELTIPSYEISAEERSILGSYCYTNSEFASTATWLGENSQLVAPFISHVVSMAEAPAMFAKLHSVSIESNRVVITQDART